MAGSKVWESIDVLFFQLNEDFIILYTVEIILQTILTFALVMFQDLSVGWHLWGRRL